MSGVNDFYDSRRSWQRYLQPVLGVCDPKDRRRIVVLPLNYIYWSANACSEVSSESISSLNSIFCYEAMSMGLERHIVVDIQIMGTVHYDASLVRVVDHVL